MPYASLAQERWAHTPAGRKALGKKLKEFDKASKGMKLPMHVCPECKGTGKVKSKSY